MTDEENLHPAEKRIRERQTIEQLQARIAELESQQGQGDYYDQADANPYGDDPAPAYGYTQNQIPQEEIDAHQRVASAATPLAPHPSAYSALDAVRHAAASAPHSALHPGSPLYQQTLEAIRKAGVNVSTGSLDHSGHFDPLD